MKKAEILNDQFSSVYTVKTQGAKRNPKGCQWLVPQEHPRGVPIGTLLTRVPTKAPLLEFHLAPQVNGCHLRHPFKVSIGTLPGFHLAPPQKMGAI